MMIKHTAFAVLAAALLAAPLARDAQATDYLTGAVGYFDVIDGDDSATMFGLEYRFDEWKYGFRPVLGGFVTTDGGTYGYGGLNWDIALIPGQLYLVPNFAVGAFGQGDGRDLGGALEFRSGIEIDYQFPNQHQVGIAFNHISNASIYDKNPGVEILLINYSVPISTLVR